MIDPSKIYVVIPCYNEDGQIKLTIDSVLRKGYSVVIVDDASYKNVWESISDLPIHFLRHSVNLGQGAALQTGTEYALKLGAEIVVHFDADGQHDANEIADFVKQIEVGKFDFVIGSRFLREQDIREIPVVRRFVLTVARFVNLVFTGVRLSDAHNDFRAMNRKAASAIEITENRQAHATEILFLMKKAKLKYIEIPTHIVYSEYSRKKGQTSLNSVNVLIDLILNKFFK